MNCAKLFSTCLVAVALLAQTLLAQTPPPERPLVVNVGKSLILDSDLDIVRVSIAGPAYAETVAISPREVLVNGLAPGETSLVMWQAGGKRQVYSLTVQPSPTRLEAIRQQIQTELGGQNVTLEQQNDTIFLRGTVKDAVAATRASMIAATLGRVVNLLYVNAPPAQEQILLKVRFANVERTASLELGGNVASSGHIQTQGATSTGKITLADILNLAVFRKDFNLSATLSALQSKNLVQILAEPNVLAIDGQQASFVAGGEFPYPSVQNGMANNSVTVAFREFGVRIRFLPTITNRGTIRLHVAPEVSSLDFANGLVYQGFNVPALVKRSVETEVELESGQSFAIAGLLDNRVTDILNKVPGLGDIPLFGKLFQSRISKTNNSELLIIITPELVRPVPADKPAPDIVRPKAFPKDYPQDAPRTPSQEVTGTVPLTTPAPDLPVEKVLKLKEEGPGPAPPPIPPGGGQGQGSGNAPQTQFPGLQGAAAGATPPVSDNSAQSAAAALAAILSGVKK